MCTGVQIIDDDNNNNYHHHHQNQVIDNNNDDDDDKSAGRELQQSLEPGAPTLAKSSEAQPIKLQPS